MSLLDLSMMPFQTSYIALLTCAFLTLAGNTAFPIVLRMLLWSALKLLPANVYFKQRRETLRFILKYPRRVYTHLFPSQHTWMLVGVLILINGSEWIALEVLDKDNPVLETLPSSIRWLDGFFQTTMTRTSGFAVFSISSLRIGIQALYLAST
jgi:Trk-type K+ transport system membrane component